ncbi:translation initiation factor IF-2-like [Apodemus sylvaticus]|uniref:translation initiation factor IF-2-like n=1 Tax=Apodemus sylvaticus TaxID=10129 RepID=UPI00224360E8|nr:translation initiation factor IF-2-like [Apodemus sylvaticus]
MSQIISARAAAGAPQAGAGGGGALPRAAARALLSGRRPPRRLLGLCQRRPRGQAGPARAPPPPRPPPSLRAGPRGLRALVPAAPHAATVGARPASPSARRARKTARAQSSQDELGRGGRCGCAGEAGAALTGCPTPPPRRAPLGGRRLRPGPPPRLVPPRRRFLSHPPRGPGSGCPRRGLRPERVPTCVRTKTAAASKASGSRWRAAENEGAVAALRPGAPHKATPDAEPPVAGRVVRSSPAPATGCTAEGGR